MIKSEKFAEQSTKVADLFREGRYGKWSRESPGRDDAGKETTVFCAVGAYCYVAHGDSQTNSIYDTEDQAFYANLVELVPWELFYPGMGIREARKNGFGLLMDYNDLASTTRDDMIKLFDDAAIKFMPDAA